MVRVKYDSWTLPKAIKDRLSDETYGRQRLIEGDGHLLIVLHEPPVGGQNERVHKVFMRTPEGQWWCNGQDDGEAQLAALLNDYRKRFVALDEADEDAVTADMSLDVLEDLTPLNRASTMLARALEAARQAAPDDRFLLAMRDQADETSRDLELLSIDATNGLSYHSARNAERHAEEARRQAVAQHKLNELAAMTLPLVTLGGLFGMNLVSGLEGIGPWLFVAVLICGVGIGFAIKSWVAR